MISWPCHITIHYLSQVIYTEQVSQQITISIVRTNNLFLPFIFYLLTMYHYTRQLSYLGKKYIIFLG